MLYFTIRFTKEKDNTTDSVAQVQSIYNDIVFNRVKDSYKVCMGGAFLRSWIEEIIRQLQMVTIDTFGNYVYAQPDSIEIAGGSYDDIYDPYLINVTYHFIQS